MVKFLSHLFDTPIWPTAIAELNEANRNVEYEWVRTQADNPAPELIPDAQLRVRFRQAGKWGQVYTLVR